MFARRRAMVGVVLAVAFVALVLVLRSSAEPVLSASCVPSDDAQGWTYANYYTDRVAHPPVHWLYPEIRLTWRAMENAEGYYIEADDPYTAARFTDWSDEIFATYVYAYAAARHRRTGNNEHHLPQSGVAGALLARASDIGG